MKALTLYCDGASRGNPGPASYGFAVFENEKLIDEDCGYIGITTNNVAEYEGLIKGMERCLELKGEEVIVKTDSQLMVRQLSGQYKVKSPHLKPLFEKARGLLEKFATHDVRHVPREENKLADAMANKALDNRS